jgi:CRP-like cAMP-binding protein/di/tricarboxylate transporter
MHFPFADPLSGCEGLAQAVHSLAAMSRLTSSPPDASPTTLAAPPSLSAAEALASTPFFSELSAVDLARLVPELEEHSLVPGEVVFHQGDPGDGFYLIRSGTVEAVVTEAGGAQVVTRLAAPAHFGEGALLTDEPRSSTVKAISPLVVWKLPRQRFETLLRDHPSIALQIAAELSTRLAEATRELAASRQHVGIVARAAYSALDPTAQALLRRIAVFGRFDVELLRQTLAAEWSATPFEQLVEEEVFFRPTEPPGWFAFLQESVRSFLLRQLWLELGDRGLQELRRRAADALRARADADPFDAIDLAREAEDWKRLVHLLEEHGQTLSDRNAVRVEAALRALPARALWANSSLVRLLALCCVAQGKLEQAVATYREAERRGTSRQPLVAIEYQRALATLYQQIGDEGASLACLHHAMHLEQQNGTATDCETGGEQSLTESPSERERSARLGFRRRGIGWGAGYGALLVSRLRERNLPVRPILALAVLALAVMAWYLPIPPSLSPAGRHVLVTVGVLVLLGFLDLLPNHLLALMLIAVWVVTGIAPAEVAASGFASSTWFLLLASMAIGAAVARSGLLYRGAVELVRHLPANHRIRCLTLGALGVVLSPGMPDPAGRVMLATPLAQDIAETLRYPERSQGSAGLALATYFGFGMMGPLFLTGSSGALIAYGLLPQETRAQLDWVHWFLAALPTCLILFLLTMGFVVMRYRPEGSDDLPEATLALQGRVLGPLSRDEWSVIVILGLLLAGFSTQSVHGIAPAWLAVAAVAVLFLVQALDDAALRDGVNVGFLLYVGVILSFAGVFAHVGLDAWLAQSLTGLSGVIAGRPLVCLLLVAGIAAVLSIALRPSPIALLLAASLVPTAASAGVDPWIVMFTAMLANNLWLYPQQNVLYQAAYYATGERSFSHEQARPLAFAYAAFVLLALMASIPYWRWLGLIA